MIKTYKFRIKDKNCQSYLAKLARTTNLIWNYCKELCSKSYKESRKYLSDFDLTKFCQAAGKDLSYPQQSINRICIEFIKVTKQFKKLPQWRSKKRSLPWIPFSKDVITHLTQDSFYFKKRLFKFYGSQPILGILKQGSFNQTASGKWFISFVCELPNQLIATLDKTKAVGIDLGLKTHLTLSNSETYFRPNLTKLYQEKLASFQRAKRKKQVTNLHQKIKNQRLDWAHKTTTEIINLYDYIFIGNVSLVPKANSKKKKDQKLESLLKGRQYQQLSDDKKVKYKKIKITSKLLKSTYDAGWFQLKTFLDYKAKQLGKVYIEVNEMYSTVTCSVCSVRSGPSGLSALGVRSWICSSCQTTHERDVNGAKNILKVGLTTQAL